MESENIANALTTFFQSEKIIKEILGYQKYSSVNGVYLAYLEILKYYLITKDTSTSYSFGDILEKLQIIKVDTHNPEYQRNVFDEGFLTSSFNGYKKDLVKKYGLDYLPYVTEEERAEIEDRRSCLNKLEDILRKSRYVREQDSRLDNALRRLKRGELVDETELKNTYELVYLSRPGGLTLAHCGGFSPERLYLGPLYGFYSIPIIIGETKENYITRVILSFINAKQTNRPQPIDASRELARKIAKYFCTNDPCFALIQISKIIDIPMNTAIYQDGNMLALRDYLNDNGLVKKRLFNRFLDSPLNTFGEFDLDNLVTETRFIPKDAISIVSLMDYFKISQIIAIYKGAKIGEQIYYKESNVVSQISFRSLYEVLKGVSCYEDLEYVKEQYYKLKEKTMENAGCSLSENIEYYDSSKFSHLGCINRIVYDETDVFNEAGEPDFSLFERDLDKKASELDEKARVSLNEIVGRGTNIASISRLNNIAKGCQSEIKDKGGESKFEHS